eukprot:CAMPEP_0204465560 /NCGR_PEP_ID=MMETSP0471-20130131/8474_1 /ASSEMBLY_ACC=CAM_ASM_000602 /TAXON_ID=2969 /ORGANISM="Oxyrrhis marina" /LENGTH=57 /DNA_ID=CAMNT_0051467109 /DNA_START=260 /DNA_END=433 /DNA_ORIENTATION=+
MSGAWPPGRAAALGCPPPAGRVHESSTGMGAGSLRQEEVIPGSRRMHCNAPRAGEHF